MALNRDDLKAVRQRKYLGYRHVTLEDIPRCFYVGRGVEKRAYSHSRNHKWHAIVKRYGLRVEICTEAMTNDEANDWEVQNIVKENTYTTNHLHDDPDDIRCNFTKGGEGTVGYMHSTSTRRKLQCAKQNRPSMSAVTRVRTGQAFLRRPRHMQEAFIMAFKGRTHTLSARKTIAHSKHKPVQATDARDGTQHTFASMKDASTSTRVHYSNISECCKGIRKSAGGFVWKFVEVTSGT